MTSSSHPTPQAEDREALIPDGVETDQLVFVNGELREDLSSSDLPDGMLRQTTPDGEKNGSCGILIDVPDGYHLARPLHLVHHVLPGECPLQVYPRILVRAGAGSSLCIIESHGGPCDATYIATAQSRFFVGQGARVEHVRVQRDGNQAERQSTLSAEVEENGDFRSHTLTLSGSSVKNDASLSLLGPKAHGEINGLYILSGNSRTENLTHIAHRVPDCSSQQVFKGVLDERSQGLFQGRIYVAQDAQRTLAEQHSDAMLLANTARSQAVPELEIYADDVKCAHGATVGTLNEESLFYLRSRGLSKDLARRILIHAFAASLFSRIRTTQMIEPLDRLLTRSLAGEGR
jgi:Fe-S cluster assembly protein SufD